jgi:glycosyltransferase involved in cell wall biosynthesis
MSKLLTIAIPSFNRATKLDRQLGWLSRNLRELEGECAVILSDNASTDATSQICATWRDDLAARGVDVLVNRNPQNIGPLANIARCIELSTSRFTWVVGDDDEIPDDKLAWIVARLSADQDLAAIVLNFNGIGKSQYPRCFTHEHDLLGDGESVMGECLKQAYFGLAFMTAQIYRTKFAQEALRDWPTGRSNYDFQVFLTANVGRRGRVLATSDTHCTYVTGDNVYEKNKRVGMTLYADSLEVFVNLRRIGYSPALCRKIAWRHLWQLKKRFVRNSLQVSPLLTLKTMGRAALYLTQLQRPGNPPQPPSSRGDRFGSVAPHPVPH